MATVKGVNKTKLDSPIGANVIAEGYNKAGLTVMYDEYEAVAVAVDDVIEMGDVIPKGAVVQNIQIAFDDLSGAGATLHVGDGADDDRFMTSVDVATAAGKASLMNSGNIDGIGYKTGQTDGDRQIQLKPKVAAITGTIKCWITYAL